MIGVKKGTKGCFGALLDHFREVDDEKIAILTFLILNGRNCGFYQEALSTRYSRLFSVNPSIFIEDLKKRKDWKDIIRTLQVGDWHAFKVGLAKLGDSEFEKELKAYAFELEMK